MSVQINWSFSVQVSNGPKISSSDTIDVDAYDSIQVTVPQNNGGDGTVVEVQPGVTAQVQFLLIKSDSYDSLSYRVADALNAVSLDTEQVLLGAGAMSLLPKAPTTLTFFNESGTDASVHILVGRKAIPAPNP
jgi:hypothetical protein